jgi:hypothetical protein
MTPRLVKLLLTASLWAAIGCNAPSAAHRDSTSKTPTVRASRGKPKGIDPSFLKEVELSILTLELDRALARLEGHSGPEVSLFQARIAIYRADCEGASARLSRAQLKANKSARELGEFAERCANATVGGHVIEDKERGIWLRLQDRLDEVLVPFLTKTAADARDAIEKDLGTTLPRPLRLDLVRDLFSLSAVSGLPLESAETTGTVAVARFGRVTMLSPRATRAGYPWQDTLAHEITHLILSRASAENAPLWLQEGVAKREETRWRSPRAFDDEGHAERVALDAQRTGRSVGVDKLGPSIAMLPSADAASIAFAEVTSFIRYVLAKCGERALPALLAELRTVPQPDRALRGVTGLGLSQWQSVWRADLDARPRAPIPGEVGSEESVILSRRAARLSELLLLGEKYEAAAERVEIELDRAPRNAFLRYQAARAALASEPERVPELLGGIDAVSGPFAGHLALLSAQPGAVPGLHEQALGLDPLLIEVACSAPDAEGAPFQASLEALCRHVRALPLRGAE